MSRSEELYWDIDSEVLADPATQPDSPPRPALPAGDGSADPQLLPEAEPLSPPHANAPWDRSRSLRKPRAEPLSFHAAGSTEAAAAARLAESAPLAPVDLAPRAPRADPMETARDEHAAGPVKMPLQRKSGEGVEMFTRLTTRPQNTPESHPSPPVAETSAAGFGKLKENSVPAYHASRLQEVIDHSYNQTQTQTSRRRSGRRKALRRRMGMVFLTMVFAGLGGTLIWVWTRPETEPQPFPPAAQTSPGDSAGTHPKPSSPPAAPVKSSLPDPSALPALSERQEAIRNALTALLQAPGWEEKLPLVLHAERLSGRMKDFYLAQKGQDPQITGVGVSQPIAGPDAWWFLLSLANPDGPPIRIAVKETPQGPRFDWENLVGYGSMPFTLFRTEKPVIPQTFRLGIRASTAFSGKYTQAEYAACEVAPRSGEPVLHAYARLGTPAASQIAGLTSKPGWNAALISLHWETDAAAPDAVAVEQASKISLPGDEDEKGAASSNENAGAAVQSGTASPAGVPQQ